MSIFYRNWLIEVKFIVLGRICEKWPCLCISMCTCISDVQDIYTYIHTYTHTLSFRDFEFSILELQDWFFPFFLFSLGSRTNHSLVFPNQALQGFQNWKSIFIAFVVFGTMTRCVSHHGLAIYIKKYLKAQEELWKLKYFTVQKYNLQKIL